ncbi:MAG TPA: POTRA domain-containing protein, partial [Treponemataceae bacterium]|nr:POTRA domain-containing protein [Treponemataceae bacterium]
MRTKILSLLLLLLCLGGVFAQTDDTWYQGKPIRTISFDGLKNVVRSELDGVFKPYIGKEFSDDLYWDILQKLYALEYFEEITPVALPGDADRKTVLLQFTVTEKPVIKSISFNGNARLRATELLEKVTLKEGDIYNELKARIDERALRDYYLERGYANIKIVSETRTNSDQSVTLQFNITEGKQTVVSRIEFQGNKVIASKTLKKAMKLKEDTFFTSGIFVESSLEEDKSTIRRYYLERGYIDMMIENVIREIDTESNPEKNLVTLTFLLKEGEQFTYGGTSIQGNSIFSSDMLLGKIRLKEGDILNQNRFDEGFQAVADVYFENGYTSNYINRREIRDNERKRVSFEIIVVESERSHIEHIIIR